MKNLNKVEEELARVTKDTPGFVVGGLKERELTYSNSMTLHELYFGRGQQGRAPRRYTGRCNPLGHTPALAALA